MPCFFFASWIRRGTYWWSLVIVSCFRSCFFLRPVMMFICVFVASRKVCTLFSAASLLALSSQVFPCFRDSDQFLDLREACCALFLHRGSTQAHICVSWRREITNSEANRVTESTFVPPPRSVFAHVFCYLLVSSELCDFAKIEPLLRLKVQARFFYVFVSRIIFWSSGGLPCCFSIEDLQGHIFVPAGATRLQIRRQMGFCIFGIYAT